MVRGKMTIGFAGNENVQVYNVTENDYTEVVDGFIEGAKIVFVGDDMWVNPTQVTYIKFKKN